MLKETGAIISNKTVVSATWGPLEREGGERESCLGTFLLCFVSTHFSNCMLTC